MSQENRDKVELYAGFYAAFSPIIKDGDNPIEGATEFYSAVRHAAEIREQAPFSESSVIAFMFEDSEEGDEESEPNEGDGLLGEDEAFARCDQCVAFVSERWGAGEAKVYAKFLYNVAEFAANSAGGFLFGASGDLGEFEKGYLERLAARLEVN